MAKLTRELTRKIQLQELEILVEFDKICRKNNLHYYLCGGTLLGAIRHKGFIPWDDDIDVCMFRDDYNKFIEIQEKELNKKKYYFQSMETDNDVILFMGKIRRKNSIYSEKITSLSEDKQGFWIDIFPIDNVSNNIIIAKLRLIKIFLLKPILYFKTGNNLTANDLPRKIAYKFIKFFSKFTTIDKTKKLIYKKIEKYNKKETKYVASFGGIYFTKEIMKREFVDNPIEAEFEGHKFYIPKNYDEYLKHFYGNYMELPPKEKQVSNHNIEKIKFPNE